MATDAAKAALGVAGILLVILVPAVLTLRTVEEGIARVQSSDPTPYGYTISLLIYLIPIATLMTWFFRNHPAGSFRRTAFWWTVGLLTPAGFLLDIVFGTLFFSFPNAGATLQIFLPGFSFETWSFVFDLPIEEFIFYSSGFVAILLVYIWCNEVWVPAYGVADYGDTSRHPKYLIQLHWHSVVYGVAALVAAVVYKKMFASLEYQEGFPLYFTFLLAAAVLPSLLLYCCARPFINWRAFSVTLLWVLLTSLLWEATLASPFGWWHYHHKWMMGMHIRAWADLPVEAAILWIAVTYTTTIVYETIKVNLHLRKSGLLESVQLHVRLTDDLAGQGRDAARALPVGLKRRRLVKLLIRDERRDDVRRAVEGHLPLGGVDDAGVRAGPVPEILDRERRPCQRLIAGALHHRAVRLAGQVQDVKQHDVAAVVHLDREPLPSAMHDGVEVAVLPIEPHRSRDVERRAVERERAGGGHARPRVVVGVAAARVVVGQAAVVQGRRHRGVVAGHLQVEAPRRQRQRDVVVPAAATGRGAVAGREVERQRVPVGLHGRHPELEQRAVLVAVAVHVGHGAVRHLEATPIEEAGPSSFCHHQRRPRRSSRTCCGSKVSSVKAKKHASMPKRRPVGRGQVSGPVPPLHGVAGQRAVGGWQGQASHGRSWDGVSVRGKPGTCVVTAVAGLREALIGQQPAGVVDQGRAGLAADDPALAMAQRGAERTLSAALEPPRAAVEQVERPLPVALAKGHQRLEHLREGVRALAGLAPQPSHLGGGDLQQRRPRGGHVVDGGQRGPAAHQVRRSRGSLRPAASACAR